MVISLKRALSRAVLLHLESGGIRADNPSVRERVELTVDMLTLPEIQANLRSPVLRPFIIIAAREMAHA